MHLHSEKWNKNTQQAGEICFTVCEHCFCASFFSQCQNYTYSSEFYNLKWSTKCSVVIIVSEDNSIGISFECIKFKFNFLLHVCQISVPQTPTPIYSKQTKSALSMNPLPGKISWTQACIMLIINRPWHFLIFMVR